MLQCTAAVTSALCRVYACVLWRTVDSFYMNYITIKETFSVAWYFNFSHLCCYETVSEYILIHFLIKAVQDISHIGLDIASIRVVK